MMQFLKVPGISNLLYNVFCSFILLIIGLVLNNNVIQYGLSVFVFLSKDNLISVFEGKRFSYPYIYLIYLNTLLDTLYLNSSTLISSINSQYKTSSLPINSINKITCLHMSVPSECYPPLALSYSVSGLFYLF